MVTKQSEEIYTFHYLPARVLDFSQFFDCLFYICFQRLVKSSLTEFQYQIKK